MFLSCAVCWWTALPWLRDTTPIRLVAQLSPWAGYKWYAGILGLVLAQAALVRFLVLERSRRGSLRAEREKAGAALHEAEVKHGAILTALPDLMFLLDEHGTYLDWYASEPRNLYVPPEQFLGKNMREVLPLQLAEVFAGKFRQVLSSGVPATVEYSLVTHNETRFFEARVVKCGDRKLLSIVRDLTEKKNAEMELQKLSSWLLSLQDEERRRIARELHDITAQNLFAITINLNNLRQQSTGLPSTTLEILTECEELCEQSLQEVRTLSYLLHPPEFERCGLIPALQWYVDGFARRSGIAVRLEAAEEIGRLPMEVESDLFRVVQEGLSNVFRHSGSQSATVLVKKQVDTIVLQITDSGCGLLYRAEPSVGGPQSGLGIPGIRDRVRRLGGHLEIESDNNGVRLVAQIPIPVERLVSETAAS